MFLYDLHQHTAGCSRCASITPEEVILSVKKCGFSGVVITNHFYHGNSSIDRDLSWADFCRAYEEDYYAVKKAGDDSGIDVIYGLEEAVAAGKEVLLYGIDPDYIGRFPELRELDLPHLSDIVRSAGGLVIQAHPFRARDYIPNPEEPLDPKYLDGYEVYNMHNAPEENEKAVILARNIGLIKTAGTDNHNASDKRRYGIATENRIRTGKDLAGLLRSGDYTLVFDSERE